MKRSAITLTLVLLCSVSLAQETESKDQTTPKRQERQRTTGRESRRYERGKLTVKDPAGFKTEGKQIFSGPQPGEKFPALKATSLTGDDKGKEIDPIALGGDGPVVVIFEDENGVAIRGLYGVADAVGKINKKSKQDLHVAVVFLTDDTEKIDRYLGMFPKLLEMGVDSVSLSKDGREGPGAYGLNRTVSQTIILAKDGKVTRNFVFPQGMLYADPHVMGGIAELIGEDRETVAEWLAEGSKRGDRMQMRDDDRAKAKAAFGAKIRDFVKTGKLTREEAGELFRIAFPETTPDATRRKR